MCKALLVAITFLALGSLSWAADKLPPGTMKKGTLANAKLIRDAKLGVASKVAVMGCTKPGDFEPYVVAMPSGAVGQQRWQELWVVSGCGKEYPVKIEFYEDGPNAANWTIAK
jgi:hypothetical protein